MKDFKCSCGHNGYMLIVDIGDGQIEFNFRTDRRRKWDGVVVPKKELSELKQMLKEL